MLFFCFTDDLIVLIGITCGFSAPYVGKTKNEKKMQKF